MRNMFNKLFGWNQEVAQRMPVQQAQEVQQKWPLQPRVQPKGQTQKLKGRETREDLPIFDVNDFEFDSRDSQKGITTTAKQKSTSVTAELVETINELNSLNIGSHILQNTDNNPYCVDENTLKLLNGKFASEHNVLPVNKTDDSVTLYYSGDSLKQKAQIVLNQQFKGKKLEWIPFDETTLKELIHDYYFNSKLFQDEMTKVAQQKFSEIRQSETFTSKRESVISFDYAAKVTKEQNHILEIIHHILCRAYQLGATDINISNRSRLGPNGELIYKLFVRFRIDGHMSTEILEDNIDPSVVDAICQVLKILSGVDFVNHKSTDSGKIKAKITYGKKIRPIEVRCQYSHCGVNGGAVSMRIQKQYEFNFDIKNIGLTRFQIPVFEKHMVYTGRGANMFSGEVNKGKNVSAICTVKRIAQLYPDKEIFSLERPIEFSIDEIMQIELAANEDFSAREETLLRSTPDVVFIAETRNSKTAEMLIRLVDSGMSTSTTIHSEDSSSVPKRLKNLGIPLCDVAQALNCISHQTLVRKICTQCVRVADTNPKIKEVLPYIKHVERLGFVNKGFTKGTGLMPDGTTCQKCGGSGYSGRTGIFEILVVSEKIRVMIEKGKSPLKIRRQAILEGMHTVFATGLGKILEGETTLAELLFMMNRIPSPESEGLDLAIDYPDYVTTQNIHQELDPLEELESFSN